MLNLLVSDLKRIFKDKIFLVACIIGAFFAIVTPVLLFTIFTLLEYFDLGGLDILGTSFTGKVLFFNCFAPGNNFGLILPILIVIIILKDFSFGTVRNKIISGHSRLNIFLSYFISTFIVIAICIFGYAFLSLGVSLLFTPYQFEPFTFNDVIYFFSSIGFVLLGYMFIAALISLIGIITKNIPITIVLYVVVTMAFTMLSTFLEMGILVLEFTDKDILISIVTIIKNCNIFGALTNRIGHLSTYTFGDVLYFTLPSLIGIVLFITCGISIFKKKDI